MIKAAIYTLIRSNANCLAVFGTKIFPLEIPLMEGTKWPCVVFRLNSIEPTFAQDQTDEWDECNVTLTVFAESYTEVETLCGYLRTAITRYRGTVGGTKLKETNFINMSDNEIFNIGQGDSDTTGIGLFSRDITLSMVIYK